MQGMQFVMAATSSSSPKLSKKKRPSRKLIRPLRKKQPQKAKPTKQGAKSLDEALITVGYEELARVLKLAYHQAAVGKGRERHAAPQGTFLPFHEQPIVTLPGMFGPGAQAFQITKKLPEACSKGGYHGKQEILGAIVYCAAMYLTLETNDETSS